VLSCVVRVVSKDSQVSDLEKYFKQQATLAEQKRKLKKASKAPRSEDHSAPAKKARLCVARTSKKSQKLSHSKNVKSDTLQTTVKAGTSSVANVIVDNSSGSEYIPSEDEINSGNIGIPYTRG